MIALKLTNVKACMSHLLLMDTFDSFLLIEGEIMTSGILLLPDQREKDSAWISFCIQSVSEKYCPPYRAE